MEIHRTQDYISLYFIHRCSPSPPDPMTGLLGDLKKKKKEQLFQHSEAKWKKIWLADWPTSHCWLEGVFLWDLVAHPLLAALARDLDASWVGTVWRRQPYVAGTGWYAANLPIHADTLMFAAGLKRLTTAVNHAPQVARLTLLSCNTCNRHKTTS